jgi:hypothetical protein
VVGAAALEDNQGPLKIFNVLERDLFFTVDRTNPEDNSPVYYRMADGPVMVIAGHEIGRVQVPMMGSMSMNVAAGARGVTIHIKFDNGWRLHSVQIPVAGPELGF